MKELLSNTEYERLQPGVVIEDDLVLRYRAVASMLGIEMPPEVEDWLLDRSFALRQILAEYTSAPIMTEDMESIQDDLRATADAFCQQSMNEGCVPVVISFDPLLLDNGAYTMQENRVSCVSDASPVIDLAGNPKGKSNRFIDPTDDPRCGAGKPIDQQIAEICSLIQEYPPESIRLALVDGSIISGRTILNFLARLPPALRANGVLAITGSTSEKGISLMNQQGVAVYSLKVFGQEPTQTITLSDLIPTLGGRMIATMEEGTPVPAATTVDGTRLTMAVDPVIGGYPAHVDLDPFEAEQLAAIRQWALQTGYGFWDSLEQLYGRTITWQDLAPLNGKMKVMLPVRQGMDSRLNENSIPATPKETLTAAARFGYT